MPDNVVAQDLSLSEHPRWRALLHYQPQLIGKDESTIDTPNFFLSPVGKYNAEAELAATINLFENTYDTDKKCLFPARYKWLKRQGVISKPFPKCPEWESFYDDIRPAGVTLLFTNAYMNNPASLFGHTLLRIDTARKGTQLLAHGANYGAFTGEQNGLLFAIYGLTGGYYGGFTVKPYYDIINQYNNIENRDIWEMSLDFTDEELDMLMAHLWEAGQTQSRYFFFSENCSYMLMEILDAVRPSLKLAQDFPAHAIPLDTMKAVYRRPNLVKNINYRPSRQNKILYRYHQMTPEQKQVFKQMIENEKPSDNNLSETEKAAVLETVYQYVQYQYVADKLELSDYRKQSFNLLMQRNKLTSKDNLQELKDGKNPLFAHESAMLGVGIGNRNGEFFQQISGRPAYTSLLDRSYGLLSGAEINFLNVTARHYDNQHKFVLQDFNLVGIKSLSPINFMFQPISYNIHVDLSREFNPDNEKEGYVFKIHGGAGGAYALTENIKAYGFVNNHLGYGGFLPHNSYAGLGTEVGVYGDFDKWRLLASAEKIFATSRFADKIKYQVGLSFDISRNSAIQFLYKFNDNHGHDEEETLLNWQIFY